MANFLLDLGLILLLVLLLYFVHMISYWVGLYFIAPIICWPLGAIKDIYACKQYQCLGFGTCKGKAVPIFKVKTNEVYVGLTFISHRKARAINHAS
jgi:hypothetical protein